MEKYLDIIRVFIKIVQAGCFIVLGLYLVRLINNKEVMREPAPWAKILSRMKTVLFVIFLLVSAMHYVETKLLVSFDYNQIITIEVDGKKIDYCEQVNDKTEENRLVHCIDGKCDPIENILMSKNFTWVVYVDKGAVFEIYKDDEVLPPDYTFLYNKETYHVYIWDYFDELYAINKNDNSVYTYDSQRVRFINW